MTVNPLMPNGAFNICCPRDCVSRHNGGTSGAPLKPLRVDSALGALLTLRGLMLNANVERTGRHKWGKGGSLPAEKIKQMPAGTSRKNFAIYLIFFIIYVFVIIYLLFIY